MRFRIAGVAVGDVNETTVIVEVLERVQQRGLPAGKQRCSEQDPREAG